MEEVKKEMPRKIEVQDLPWNELSQIGITQDGLTEEQLGALCRGDLTDSLPLKLTGGDKPFIANGRLGVFRDQDGQVQYRAVLERARPDLERYRGHRFTPEEREQLYVFGRTTQPLILSKPDGGQYRALCEIDPQTNVAMIIPLKAIRKKEEIAQVQISPEQMASIRQGKYVKMEGLKKKDGEVFNAYVYYSAVKDDLAIMSEGKYQSLENKLKAAFQNARVPSELFGVALTSQEQDAIKQGAFVWKPEIQFEGQQKPGYLYYSVIEQKIRTTTIDPSDPSRVVNKEITRKTEIKSDMKTNNVVVSETHTHKEEKKKSTMKI